MGGRRERGKKKKANREGGWEEVKVAGSHDARVPWSKDGKGKGSGVGGGAGTSRATGRREKEEQEKEYVTEGRELAREGEKSEQRKGREGGAYDGETGWVGRWEGGRREGRMEE